MRGLRLALSWLTVLPARVDEVDARTAASAIRWAPVAGALLGVAAAGVLAGLTALDVPGLAAGLLTVGFLALATRGMHVDGLADTADGLGCYGPPARALAVMRDGGAGPFAVVTLLVVLGGQAAALAELADSPWAVVVAVAAGRAAFAWPCRRGVPAARPEGLGALVAGSQPWWVAPAWWAVLAAAAVPAGDEPWQGPVALLLAALTVVALSAHTRRRLAGTTGDVLGAVCEISVLVVATTLSR